MKTDNLFVRALDNNEVGIFLIGEGGYYFSNAKVDYEEPQNIPQAFDSLIYEYWRISKDPRVPGGFTDGLISILESHHDQCKAVYVGTEWLFYYLYCAKKRGDEPDGYYKDIFNVNVDRVAASLASALDRNHDKLITDKRWAGAEWNSSDGLWEVVMRMAGDIKKLGGPDLTEGRA